MRFSLHPVAFVAGFVSLASIGCGTATPRARPTNAPVAEASTPVLDAPSEPPSVPPTPTAIAVEPAAVPKAEPRDVERVGGDCLSGRPVKLGGSKATTASIGFGPLGGLVAYEEDRSTWWVRALDREGTPTHAPAVVEGLTGIYDVVALDDGRFVVFGAAQGPKLLHGGAALIGSDGAVVARVEFGEEGIFGGPLVGPARGNQITVLQRADAFAVAKWVTVTAGDGSLDARSIDIATPVFGEVAWATGDGPPTLLIHPMDPMEGPWHAIVDGAEVPLIDFRSVFEVRWYDHHLWVNHAPESYATSGFQWSVASRLDEGFVSTDERPPFGDPVRVRFTERSSPLLGRLAPLGDLAALDPESARDVGASAWTGDAFALVYATKRGDLRLVRFVCAPPAKEG